MIDAVLFDLGDTIIDFGVGRREAEVLFRQGAKLTYETLRAEGHKIETRGKRTFVLNFQGKLQTL